MPDSETQLKQELIRTDEEFRRLHEEHQNLERRLEELHHGTLLSQQAEQEEKQIKRQKLRLKDRMEAILRAHRDERVPV